MNKGALCVEKKSSEQYSDNYKRENEKRILNE